MESPVDEISRRTAGPRGVEPGTTARIFELASRAKSTFTSAMVSVQPCRLAGNPVAETTMVPPVGMPESPVARLRTGARRLIGLAAAWVDLQPCGQRHGLYSGGGGHGD